ncbi:MAG TPA: polysaccharide biosynthesis tyrosine autokinase [Steroidobacteraceae bacterium]|nr:polysaccharide biosynthesis tyrosine autokinase [Steroidobacteraceae bacterium]
MAIAPDTNLKAVEIPPHLDTRLGEILYDEGTLSEQDFKRIQAAQNEKGECFSDVALRLGLITELEVRRALAVQCELAANLSNNKIFSSALSMVHRPKSARAEAIRSLRSELMSRCFARNHQILMVTEVRHDDGANVLAADLACAFSQLGRRTLLIDANLRTPQQQGMFKMEGQRGLVDFLKGYCNPQDLLHSIPGFYHLSVIFAGKPPVNPQELLSLTTLRYLFDSVQKAFDTAIVVAPPLADCADAQVVASRTHGCILSARRNITPTADVELAAELLSTTRTELLGVVLDG